MTKRNWTREKLYFFPAVSLNGKMMDLVAILKAKIILEHQCPEGSSKYPNTSKRVEYTDIFLFNNEETRLEFLCKLDNPYKSDFLQKLHSHNSRVGIPDIKKLI